MNAANDARLKVITYPELAGIFITFAAVLWLLFPKSMIEHQILNETSNYDLTVAYLENMLRLEPENESMMMALAETAMLSGKYELARRLVGVLLDSHTPEIRAEAFWLKYRLRKFDPHSDITPEAKQNELRAVLTDALAQGGIAPSLLNAWYSEAIWLGQKDAALHLSALALRTGADDSHWLRQRYALALELHRNALALQTAQALADADPLHRETWLSGAYYLALGLHDDAACERILRQLEPFGMQWSEALAALAMQQKAFVKASKRYLALAQKSPDAAQRRQANQMAITALLEGGDNAGALALAKTFEAASLNDPGMTTYLLKLYLGLGDLDAASSFSRRLLRIRDGQ